MKYIKVIFWDKDARPINPIFIKDFRVRSIFEPFVEAFTRKLVRQGYIFANEHYAIIINPHYTPLTDSHITVSNDISAWDEYTSPYSLEYTEPVRESEAFLSFTLKLLISERSLMLTQDFSCNDVFRTITTELATILVRKQLISRTVRFMPLFYLRDDENADFQTKQHDAITPEIRALVELLPEDDDLKITFTPRSLSAFPQRQAVGAASEDDPLIIVLDRQALAEMQTIAHADVPVEQGGMLVGDVYLNDDVPGGYIVVITNQIYAEKARGTHTELRYTFADWQHQQATLRDQYPEKRIVGWYHTHLLKSIDIDEQGRIQATELFFSQDDVFIQTQFFADKWYIAIVLNPAGELAFFVWDNDVITKSTSYFLL